MNQEEQYSFSPLDSYQWINKEADVAAYRSNDADNTQKRRSRRE